MTTHTLERGLTLIELLVTLAVGSFVVGTATSLYLTAARSHAIEASVLEPMDNAALALALIARDLRQAGRPPPLASTSAGTPVSATLPTSPVCENTTTWVARTDLRVFGSNDPGGAPHAFDRCLTLDASPLTDVVMIWTTDMARDHSEPITVSYYLAPAPRESKASPCAPASSLYRLVQQRNKRPYREEVVTNIEALQFTFGLDNDNDGGVDRYDVADAVVSWDTVVSVRVEIVARASCPLSSFINTTAYNVGEHTMRPVDGFRRVALSTVISLRFSARHNSEVPDAPTSSPP